MRIGQLARASGVSADTIRYYEKVGLMPAVRRTESGYREYPSGATNRIRVIRNAVQLGFPLKEIARVLRIRDSGGAPCRQVRDYASEIVVAIDRRIAALHTERQAMLEMIAHWDALLAHAPAGARAHLLEDNSIAMRASQPRQSRLRRSGRA
jgi:DNA-binding transcriptional MerR regulator